MRKALVPCALAALVGGCAVHAPPPVAALRPPSPVVVAPAPIVVGPAPILAAPPHHYPHHPGRGRGHGKHGHRH
jgi:hypothetical protein